jgi:hypothetical protein
MNRGLLFISLFSIAALFVTQACSSEESTGANDGGTTSSTSTSSGSIATASSSGESSSGSEDTCVAGGGACVCGGTTSPCPLGGTRDPALKCAQPAQGSGQCSTTCCKGGDSGPPTNPDAAVIVEAGTDAPADAPEDG